MSGVRHSSSQTETSDGTRLFTQRWEPDGPPHATVLLVHGFGEHSGRYGHVVAALVPLGIAIQAFDLRGHGRSSGQRGFIGGWSDYRRDLKQLADETARRATGPFFLYGHSMGGLITLDYVLHERPEVSGVIVTGPLLAQPGVSPFLLALGRLLSRVWPRFSLSAGLDSASISRDPEVVAAYEADPLVHSRGTARLASELGRTVDRVHDHAAALRAPLLVLHGGADAIAPPEASRRFHDHAGSADKRRVEIPGGFHEPHNDVDRIETLATVCEWLAARIPAAVPDSAGR